MTAIATRLQAVHNRIAKAALAAGRDPHTVQLLAVSKTWPTQNLRDAYAAGQRMFGESYVQEALEKIGLLRGLPLEWHFIGPLQSNKTRAIAEHFDWVHSVERLKIAERLSAQRPTHLPPLQICLQINVSGEASKSGATPQEAPALAEVIRRLPNLRLRGLMAIPQPTADVALQRRQFKMLRELLEALNERGMALDTLSMGMSHDLEAAIAEGATMVRVGTAIFGERH
ncbi:MAG: YggS family pyridoxal phosphate-dependent enzyme [Pseudomonadota bacterium]